MTYKEMVEQAKLLFPETYFIRERIRKQKEKLREYDFDEDVKKIENKFKDEK